MNVMGGGADIGVGGKEQVAEKYRQGGDERQKGRKAESDDQHDRGKQVAGVIDQKTEARALLVAKTGKGAIERVAEPVDRNPQRDDRQPQMAPAAPDQGHRRSKRAEHPERG